MRRPFAAAFLLTCLLLAPGFARAADKVALVIGNANYTDLSPLNNTVNDARAMAQTLGELGFEAQLVLDATEGDLRRAIRQFTAESAGKALAVVFYAGHGVQVEGENYILPTDFEPPRAESDIKISGLKVDDLLAAVHARVRVVFLDACRDNPGVARRLSSATRSMGQSGLAPIKSADVNGDAGIFIAFATAAGSVAQDGDGSHSPFTQALLDNIKSPVSIDDMFSMVTKQVSVSTRNTQRPYKYASLDSIVCLGVCGAAGIAPESVPATSVTYSPSVVDPNDRSLMLFGVSAADGAKYYLGPGSVKQVDGLFTLQTQTLRADGSAVANGLAFNCKQNMASVYSGAVLRNGRKLAGIEFYSAPEISKFGPIERGTLYASLALFACDARAIAPDLAQDVVFSNDWVQIAIDALAIRWSVLPSSIKRAGGEITFAIKHDMPEDMARPPVENLNSINDLLTYLYAVKVMKAAVDCDAAVLKTYVTEGWTSQRAMTGKYITPGQDAQITKLEPEKVGAEVAAYVCSKSGKKLVMQ